MAQSPETATPAANDLERYLLNWAALGQMIDEGRSFSGYERNCAFLNVNGTGFATVSASSGLDLLDDGRALASCDWNFDGKLDFWVANRTAPKVRLLMNESKPADGSAGFVALRLRGSGSNRDAIGARVEIYPGKGNKKYLRTVRAGEGFLAQSSKWLHFGLGALQSIDRVIVRWPGADAEPFTGVTPGGFFELNQGTGNAKSWQPPDFSLPAAPGPVREPTTASYRTWIIGRVPLPKAGYTSWKDERETLQSLRGKPVAVNLWSSTCLPCMEELQEWSKARGNLEGSGLQVLALNVDGLGPDAKEPTGAARKTIEKLQLPFLSGVATAELIEAMEIVHRTFASLKKPLPVPTTFLLDGRGRVAAIYKGRTSVDTLLADVALLEKPVEHQRAEAVPFAGRWASRPFESDPMRVALTYSTAGKADMAVAYLADILEEPEEHLAGTATKETVQRFKIDGQVMLGELYLEEGDAARAAEAYGRLLKLSPDDAARHRAIGEALLQRNLAQPALDHLRAALKTTPDDANLLFNLALAEMGTRQSDSAIRHFREALSIQPDDLATHFQLANALLARKDTATAIIHYREALRIEPNWPFAAHQLAWILATHPEPSLRNGDEALALAEAVCQRDGGGNPVTLHTWSAALAELGRYGEALQISARAAQIAESEPRYADFLQTVNDARALLRKKRPIRSR